jgi:hypothetical protein
MSDQDWPSDEVMIRNLVEDFIESDAVPQQIEKEVDALSDTNNYQQALKLILRKRG